MAGFFSKKQYAAMAESAFAMKLLKDRCLECSICAILINEFFILFFTFVNQYPLVTTDTQGSGVNKADAGTGSQQDFVGAYNVVSLGSAEDALKQLGIQLPDLIISDVMMLGMDGMSFAKKIKSDKLLSRIPLIQFSALNNIDEQTRGIESGAEAYITKPFNVEYLEKVARRLLQREEDLKEYYSSVLSAFELDNGHFLHKEDKSFFEKMMQIIDSHIQNTDLSVELLSSSLGYSTRQFYRKLKNVTEKTPADIIREYRLTIVERLLLTTQLSIEEIMDKTGFSNRGTFYKAFAQKFEMTPKQYRNIKTKDVLDTSEEGGAMNV